VRIRRVLGDWARLVEHIGSTSVPGLAAKPVIDIFVGVDDADDEAAYLADLVADGFDLRVREPGHRCLRGSERGMPINLHCYAANAAEVERYLRLRGWLRGHEHDRLLYETTKRRLAGRQWPDMNYYAEAKSPVIEEILSRARAQRLTSCRPASGRGVAALRRGSGRSCLSTYDLVMMTAVPRAHRALLHVRRSVGRRAPTVTPTTCRCSGCWLWSHDRP